MQLPDEIDVPLVQRLIVSQFPQWEHLPIRRVEPNGWDNRTFRLGEDVWARARGWALWKALITLSGAQGTNPAHAASAARVLGDILIDET